MLRNKIQSDSSQIERNNNATNFNPAHKNESGFAHHSKDTSIQRQDIPTDSFLKETSNAALGRNPDVILAHADVVMLLASLVQR